MDFLFWRQWVVTLALSLTLVGAESPLPLATGGVVDFARDILPLLQSRCIECHGPAKQKSGLRLDDRMRMLQGGDDLGPSIRPGDSAGSPLIRVVSGLVPDKKMPEKGPALSVAEIGLLRAWIDQGAKGSESAKETAAPVPHWSFQPVRRPMIPVGYSKTINPIDAFVRAELKRKGIKPSSEADRTTLIRRLYSVMLGVPPTLEEVEAFRVDRRPLAFERLVDRVLEDPAYGERWGRHWLDVIRFAESNGFETNRERTTAWRFRDYIIQSLNEDKPYDQFVREQIAGDALGVDVATGFLVGGPWDIVGSPDPALTAQQRADQLDDMVNTTGTAFLGLTLGCARCHTHKFDPITHREYYAMTAIFGGVRQGERALPRSAEQEAALQMEIERILVLEKRLEKYLPKPVKVTNTALLPPVNARLNEDSFPTISARFVRFTISSAGGGQPCLDELEVWSGSSNVALASHGTKATANGTLAGYEIHQLAHINDGRFGNTRSWISSVSDQGWIQLELPQIESIQRITWGRDREGLFTDRLATNYRIEVAESVGQWKTVSGSDLRQPIGVVKPKKPEYRFEGISETESREGKKWLSDLEEARKRREEFARTPMVHAGIFSQPKPAHRLHRGDPLQLREAVTPATLDLFQPVRMEESVPEQRRRLTLAHWITRSDHPLTARVIVNRIWQQHFGVGLVDTPSDFGRNGTRPTHPELLDCLADELVHPNRGSKEPMPLPWTLKRLHRLILCSATWKQSGTPRTEALRTDAGNRLLWRFQPRRLEAEGIRDTILAVSGSLNRTAGGPSFYLLDVDRENVYHYRPKEDFGPAESRRMVYAFKVRMEQDGVFGAFDCPDGSLVTPRRTASTTPLQALNLFNSRFILKQSDLFAERLKRESGASIRAQIQRGWELTYGRRPDRFETDRAEVFLRKEGLPALCRALLNSNEFLFIP